MDRKDDIFEKLAVVAGCDYISDLRFEPYNSIAKKYLQKRFSFESCDIAVLEDLYDYIYSYKARFASMEEAKVAFCRTKK